MWETIARSLSAATGDAFAVEQITPLGGGSINRAYLLAGRTGHGLQPYFVKTNSASKLAMFEAEAAGLHEIFQSGALRVPRPTASGIADEGAWLAMEYLELARGSPASASAAAATLGEQLAALHRTPAKQFGWHRDNTIGSTPQINTPNSNWVVFFRERRLLFQLQLAARNGYGGSLHRQGDKLAAKLENFFVGYTPQPALLHGDLWGGNYGCIGRGKDALPVIFDPAVYYGDREADIAMTELFGGFPERFYAAYRESWPLDAGYATRKTLYNLYHVLNHLNLFGGGYLRQAERMMDKLLAEL